MSTSSTASTGGTSILGLLGIVFVALKLCGVIDWSWWWVTAPFWGGLAFVLACALVAGLAALAIMAIEKLKR